MEISKYESNQIIERRKILFIYSQIWKLHSCKSRASNLV